MQPDAYFNPQTLAFVLDALPGSIDGKVLAVAKVVLCLEAECQRLDQRAHRLQKKTRLPRQRAYMLRRWLREELERVRLAAAEDQMIRVSLGESQPSLRVVNSELVPSKLQTAALRLPLSLVPPRLWPFIQHLDVNRAVLLETFRRTGPFPRGVALYSQRHPVRITRRS